MNSLDTLEFLTKFQEFDHHRLVLFNYDENTGLRSFIAIHRLNNKSPSFGATRYLKYGSEIEALKDVLRLSKIMSYKAAIVGLPGGGAKAVIIADGVSEKKKKDLFREYSRRINDLSGKFVTGSDVGLTKEDVKIMRRISPYFVGIKVFPEKFTSLGIYYCLKEALKQIYGNSDMRVRSIAIQGLGKIGVELLKLVYKEVKEIFVADVDETKIKSVKKEYPKVKVTPVWEIHKKGVNIFSPCALSNCINYKNINELKCDIILGGANNQLEDDKLSEILHKMGILYAPDYAVNAGGLISVYEEYKNNNFKLKRVQRKVKNLQKIFAEILSESRIKNRSPLEISNRKAERIFNKM